MTEELGLEEDAMYRQWYDMDYLCTDDDDENTNDEYFDDDDLAGGDDSATDSDSATGSDGDDNDGDGDDHSDDDDDADDDDDDFLDEDDKDLTDTFEDDVAPFRSMGFLGASNLFSAMHHGHSGSGRHCPRLNWIKQPDLYKKFTFNPPSGKVNKLPFKESLTSVTV